MNEIDLTAARFARPFNLRRDLREHITGPFFERPEEPAAHDMLLLNVHPEFTPEPPPRELTFFNIDFP